MIDVRKFVIPTKERDLVEELARSREENNNNFKGKATAVDVIVCDEISR
jgi:hypothetical protein